MPSNINQMLGLASAAGAAWYAFTGNTQALKVFAGIVGVQGLVAAFNK